MQPEHESGHSNLFIDEVLSPILAVPVNLFCLPIKCANTSSPF
jgi:hypothetical protein